MLPLLVCVVFGLLLRKFSSLGSILGCFTFQNLSHFLKKLIYVFLDNITFFPCHSCFTIFLDEFQYSLFYREEESLVEEFVFEALVTYLESLALAHADEKSLGGSFLRFSFAHQFCLPDKSIRAFPLRG